MRRASFYLRVVAFVAGALLPAPDVEARVLVTPGQPGYAWAAHEGIIQRWSRDGSVEEIRHSGGIPSAAVFSEPLNSFLVAGVDGGITLLGSDLTPETVRFEGRITQLLETGEGLFALEGLAGKLHLFDGDSFRLLAELGGDAAHLRIHSDELFVVSRGEGRLLRLSASGGAITASASAPHAVSDLEVDATGVYLALPQSGEVAVYDRETLGFVERFRIGSAPVDLLLSGSRGVLGSGRVVIADPAHRAIVSDERNQSLTAAVARGFLRGLLGLGLARAEVRRVPGRPDVIAERDGVVAIQDSSSGTLWHLRRGQTSEIGIAAADAFAITADGEVVYWDRNINAIRWYHPQRNVRKNS